MAPLEVLVGGRRAHLGADAPRVARQQSGVVTRVERPPVLRLEAVAVQGPDAEGHGVLLGPIRRQRRPRLLRGVGVRDLAEVERAEDALLRALARRDRLEVLV